MIAGGLVAAAIGFSLISGGPEPPAPVPPAPDGLTLVFAGPTAAEDRETLRALAAEFADRVEADGERDEPRLRTAAQFDVLRTVGRDLRCRGERIGDRQPAVRDAVEEYLNERLGNSGGPVDAAARGEWVAAYRAIAEACDGRR